ncbi:MAG: addiction module protein [Micrococcales bacterium]|nr:addiction module protein [Micrococcales bacterium]
MAPELAALIEAGRCLAPEERYELANQMLASVEPTVDPAGADEAWRAELRRRIDDIDSGRVQLVDHAETVQIARDRLAARRATGTA